MKKKYKLKKWVKVSMLILLIITLYQPLKTSDISETVVKKQKLLKQKKEVVIKTSNNKETIQEEPVEETTEEPIQEEQEEIQQDTSYTTRMTSYYPNDSYGTGSITGSGLGPNDFQINEYGWYTYQDKLVVATATEYLLKYGYALNEDVHTYKYYDELTLNIEGIDYQVIVLDSCGSAMSTGRIDLFVTDEEHIKDVDVIVKE